MDEVSEQSDEALVSLSLQQKEVFGVLIKRYDGALSRYIRRLGARDEEDVLDILQETFIKVYRNLNEFDTSLKFSSWIYRIAHNEAISWFRKKHVRPEGHLVDDGESIIELTHSEEWGSEYHFDVSLNSAVLNRAMQQLSDKYREVVILRFFEHKEYDEISDILKIPIGSVGTLLHRAKKEIIKHIDHKKISV